MNDPTRYYTISKTFCFESNIGQSVNNQIRSVNKRIYILTQHTHTHKHTYIYIYIYIYVYLIINE